MSGGLFVAVITAAVLLAGLTLVLLGYLGMRARQDRQLERRVLGAEVIRDEFDDSADAAPLKLLARSGQRIEKLTDDKGETYYLVNVRTSKRTLESNGEELPVIPGMVADVDVRTGEKTVLGYLMKPLTRMQQSALRER